MPKIVSHMPDGDRVSQLEPGTNLLEGLLNEGVPMNYNCKKGTCGSCRIKVIMGNDSLSTPSFNERELLDSNEIARGISRLACEIKVGDKEVEIQQFAPRSISTTLEDW